jgi:hypothetical protein
MTWVKLIPDLIKFIITTLPEIIEYWIKSSKDKNYRARINEIDAKVEEYERTRDLDALNEISK